MFEVLARSKVEYVQMKFICCVKFIHACIGLMVFLTKKRIGSYRDQGKLEELDS